MAEPPAGSFGGIISMTISRAFGAMVALFLAAAQFNAVPARADTVFDFTGVCNSGCTGTATGVLTLVDFFDDDNGMVDDATFISFDIRPRVAASSSPSRTAGAPMASCTTTADLSGVYLFRRPPVFPPSMRLRMNST